MQSRRHTQSNVELHTCATSKNASRTLFFRASSVFFSLPFNPLPLASLTISGANKPAYFLLRIFLLSNTELCSSLALCVAVAVAADALPLPARLRLMLSKRLLLPGPAVSVEMDGVSEVSEVSLIRLDALERRDDDTDVVALLRVGDLSCSFAAGTTSLTILVIMKIRNVIETE